MIYIYYIIIYDYVTKCLTRYQFVNLQLRPTVQVTFLLFSWFVTYRMCLGCVQFVSSVCLAVELEKGPSGKGVDVSRMCLVFL